MFNFIKILCYLVLCINLHAEEAGTDFQARSLNSNVDILDLENNNIYSNSWAVIIGINDYDYIEDLNFAVQDAEDIQKLLLDKFQFKEDHIKLLINEDASLTNIKSTLFEVANNTKENDRLLIFYAGHGETIDISEGGELGYLLPVDGKKDNLYATSLSMREIKDATSIAKAKHVLLLIDACYSGLMAVGSKSISSQVGGYLKKITTARTRQIITAGSRGEIAIEKSEWGHSAFTKNLLTGLSDGLADIDYDGFITGDELGSYLKKQVSIDSDNIQTPQKGKLTNEEGEFIFFIDHDQNKTPQNELNSEHNKDEFISELSEQLKQSSEINALLLEELRSNKGLAKDEGFNKMNLSYVYPGLGHIAMGETVLGIFWMGLEATTLFGAYSLFLDYNQSKQDYEQYESIYLSSQTQDEINNSREDYGMSFNQLILDRNELLGMISLSAAIWAGNIWSLDKINNSAHSIGVELNNFGMVEISVTF